MRYALPLLVLLTLGALGCQHIKTPAIAFTDDGGYLPYRGGKGLVARTDSPIPDVPMPVGFKPVTSRSSSSFDGMIRSVNHTYQGRARFADAVDFYRSQLALHGWDLVGRADQNATTTTLSYTKGREKVDVYIHQGDLLNAIDSSVTTIVIQIGAGGQ